MLFCVFSHSCKSSDAVIPISVLPHPGIVMSETRAILWTRTDLRLAQKNIHAYDRLCCPSVDFGYVFSKGNIGK